ncbi:MAG: ATP-binding cassette domain-containing protein [Mucilaginibacter sp.]
MAYIFWIMLFLNARRQLNQKSFEISTKNQGAIIELVSGMQEIRLNNCEQQKRWEWENIQASLFNYSIRLLKIGQLQHGGATLINEFKNLVITYLSVRAVMNGDLTLGAMMATQYIIGQLNMPLDQVVSFIQGYQDANLSLERLNEIQEMENEETVENDLRHALPESKTIAINEITFSYPGTENFPVLKNLSMTIPEGKTTAIVGMSGGGKTSLIKLLLRFYESQSGDIFVGMHNIKEFSFASWREKCGVVMQDGFIFSDTIEGNIAVGGKSIDAAQLLHAIKVANLEDFISDLPLGLLTKIGADGNGLSQGQKQRILIARAVYKDPQYLFFDEAINALDATNELTIMTNLQEFFNGKTVVIVAHRLSTVNNADNIVVLKNGEIIEQGKHTELIASGKGYYQLVKNQLELGL